MIANVSGTALFATTTNNLEGTKVKVKIRFLSTKHPKKPLFLQLDGTATTTFDRL